MADEQRQPATKGGLQALRGEVNDFGTALRAEIKAMEDPLTETMRDM